MKRDKIAATLYSMWQSRNGCLMKVHLIEMFSSKLNSSKNASIAILKNCPFLSKFIINLSWVSWPSFRKSILYLRDKLENFWFLQSQYIFQKTDSNATSINLLKGRILQNIQNIFSYFYSLFITIGTRMYTKQFEGRVTVLSRK